MYHKFAFTALALLTLLGLVLTGAPRAQAQAACVETYTVAAGDTLGSIAEKYLGEIGAYPQIVTATNEAAKTDTSFKTIADANVIEVGQKLCIPAKSATAPTTTAPTTAPAQSAGAAAGLYTNTGPAADASALIYLLTLDPNGGAVMTQSYVSKSSFVSTGSWSQNGNAVTVKFTTQDGKANPATVVLNAEADKLTTTQDDAKIFNGTTGFVLAKTPADVVALSGVYNTTLAAAGDKPERFIAFTLTPDAKALFIQNPTGQDSIVETGTWTASGANATINLTKRGDADIQEKFVFALQGENFVASEYNKEVWGADGLTLKRVEGIGATSAPAAVAPTPTATATPAPAVAPLTLAQLGNTTYMIQDAPNGDVALKEGKAEEEIAPGSASKYTAQLGDQLANGTLDGKAYAATILITSGGGSGTFYNVAAVPNNNGTPGTGITFFLGDRIQVQSLKIENGAIHVSYLDRKADEPMTAAPTVAQSKVLVIDNGKLAEGATILPVPEGSLEGTYIAWGPAADASGLLWNLFLGPNGNASWLSNYVGKGTINSTGVWEQTTATTINLTLIHRDGQNIGEEFTFEAQGDQLVATQYNQSLYGANGITFYKANGTVKGTVTYLEKIALPNDAVYEVYLLDVSNPDAPGTYISGISNRTNGDQVPLAFEIPYAPSQISPNGKYIVQAFISSNGKLLFKNSNGVAVITNGAPTSNVQVVVAPPAQ